MLKTKWPVILFFSSLLASCWLGALAFYTSEQQFSFLADSFWQGRLYFIEALPSYSDTVLYEGRYFWPLGPGPALLLMVPVAIFKLFGLFFYQNYLFLALVPLVFWLVYKLARKLDYQPLDSFYLAYAFCFASAFLGVASMGWSWYLAQVLTVALLFLSLFEFFTKRRHLLIGLIFGLIFLTRPTAGLCLSFFLLEIFLADSSRSDKFSKFLRLAAPVLVVLLLLGVYNFLRFDNFWEQGYSRQGLLTVNLDQARSYGLFSPKHLPGNLYYLFFHSPLPVWRDGVSHVLQFPFIKADHWGLGLFFLSPYLLGLFFRRLRGRTSWLLLGAAGLAALPILFYYGIGFRQFGYRYALDFLPLIFVLFMINYRQYRKELSSGLKFLIIVSSLFTQYLFFTFIY